MNAYLRALRLERWPRSSAIFLGSAVFVFLHREDVAALSPAETIWRLAAAFLLTWGISTANYVLNEIVDRPFDVHHPTKRLRPLVSGEIKAFPFALIGLLLVAACGGAAVLLFDRTFTLALLSLLAAGIVYNVPPIRSIIRFVFLSAGRPWLFPESFLPSPSSSAGGRSAIFSWSPSGCPSSVSSRRKPENTGYPTGNTRGCRW